MQSGPNNAAPTAPPSIIKSERALDLVGNGKFGGDGWIAGHVGKDKAYYVRTLSPENIPTDIKSSLGNTTLIDINNKGVVIGRIEVPDSAPTIVGEGFLYTPAGGLQRLLEVLPKQNQDASEIYTLRDVNPIAINNAGVITGTVRLNINDEKLDPPPRYVFTWKIDDFHINLIKGMVDDVRPSADAQTLKLPVDRVAAINEAGELALGCGDTTTPCVFNSERKLVNIYDTNMPEIPTNSWFAQMNNTGLFGVEFYKQIDDVPGVAVALWSFKEGLVPLPMPEGYVLCDISAIDENQVAAGVCVPSRGFGGIPIVWKNGEALNLNVGLTAKDNYYWDIHDIDQDGRFLVSGNKRSTGNFSLYIVTLK